MNFLEKLAYLLIGCVIGISISKYEEVILVLKSVNWSGLTYWVTLFIGATIPIMVNYFLIKKQEVIKLKSKIIQDKIDIIRDYKSFDLFMRQTVILDKKIEDLEFEYEPTPQDLSAPTIRCLGILTNKELYNTWRIANRGYIEKLNSLGNNKISNYTRYIDNYILNLDILLESIYDEKLWNVAVAVKNDFINMSLELSSIIDEYLTNSLYKFKDENKKIKNEFGDNIQKKMKNTNLIKYRNQLFTLENNN